DIIIDFDHVEDVIWLESSIFGEMTPGALDAAAFFIIGSGAMGEEDRILYDSATGALFFDADGSGSGEAVQFAILSNLPTDLAADDFVVVDTTTGLPVTTAVDRDEPDAPTTADSYDHDGLFGPG